MPTLRRAATTRWLARPKAALLAPGPQHIDLFGRLSVEAQARGAMVRDAPLAALAIEPGAVLCTTDRDFSRLPGLKTATPLEDRPSR